MHDLTINKLKPKGLKLTLIITWVFCLFTQSFSWAQAPEEQGQESLEPTSAEISHISNQEDSSGLQAAENTYDTNLIRTQNKLAHLEGLVDAYDSGIAELSLELGNLFVAQGNSEDALSAFHRALHVSRINHGLDSSLQLPVLEAILDVQTSTNQIQSAEDTLGRIYRVHQENYGPQDPATINILTRIGIWHFSAYFFEIDRSSLAHLLKARGALGHAHNFSRQSKQGYDFDLYNLLAMTDHGLASMANETASHAANNAHSAGGSPGSISIVSGSYRRGKLLLETGIEDAKESGHIESIVRASLLYADWSQMFNKRHAARKQYISAYEAAQNLPAESLLRQVFNYPHRLPDFNSAALQFGPKAVKTQLVPVSFDVDKWGASGSIEILSENDDEKVSSSVKRAARSTVRSAAYRPAIVNGQPIGSKGVTQTVIVEL